MAKSRNSLYVVQAIGKFRSLKGGKIYNPYISQDNGLTQRIIMAKRYTTRKDARFAKNAMKKQYAEFKTKFRVVRVGVRVSLIKENP